VPDPGVAVVLCTYTRAREELLLEAIGSLRAQTVAPADVVVVVDHNQVLLEAVRRRAPDVVAVANDHAPGLAGARNTGVEAATGDVVAFLDDDALAAPDWIERLRDTYEDPAVAGAGGLVRPIFAGRRPAWLPEEFDWVVGCSYRGQPVERAHVRNLLGCNMSFRRELLLEVGGFPEGVGRGADDALGCEETELCIRLQQQHPDVVLLYDPAIKVGHHVGGERVTLRYFLRRCRAEGLSKAEVARRCGTERGLESERTYTRRTLPAGARDGLLATVTGEPSGIARTGAIVLGLAATTSGYLGGIRPLRRR
jgi:GT2 family glycosyltransferase